MLKIKLSQTGKKKSHKYRIIVAEAKSKRDGKNIDIVGWYDPSISPSVFKISSQKLKYWLERGAKLTPAVRKIINNEKSA